MKLEELKKQIKMPELQALVKKSNTVRSANTLGRGSKSSKDWGQMYAEVIVPTKLDPKDKAAAKKAFAYGAKEVKKAFKDLPIEIKNYTVPEHNVRVKGQPDAGTITIIFNIKGHPHYDNNEIAKRDQDYMND